MCMRKFRFAHEHKPRLLEKLREFDFLGRFRHAWYPCMVKRPYTHEPDKLRVLSESTRWMDLLIHWPTEQLQKKVADAQPSNWNWFSEDQAHYRRGTPKNIEKLSRHVSALLLLYNAHSSLSIWIYENVINNNKLKKHVCANIKKKQDRYGPVSRLL